VKARSSRIVVKIGGGLLEDPSARAAVVAAAARCSRAGHSLVLVHGGGRAIDAELASRGIPKRIHQGLRVTDGRTLRVVVAVLATWNRKLVAELEREGAAAAGLCGADGGLLKAARHAPVEGVELGLVGSVTTVAPDPLDAMLAEGILPVLAPIAAGPAGELLNVNADAAAAAVAAALRVQRLIFLTDVEGVADETGRVIGRLDPEGARRLLQSPAVTGGMRPKLAACLAAADAGVAEVVIAGPARRESVLAGGRGGTLVAA
jgi:acetylglutamate kinase